jgi:translation initiation factor IF-3
VKSSYPHVAGQRGSYSRRTFTRHRGPVLPEKRERINEQIRFSTIRVISDQGEQLGLMSPDEALSIARDKGLDLVEVAPDARPPVCKILDYGKFRYEISKRPTNKPKSDLKTITLRPKTGEHDLLTKLRNARKFLEKGNRVKFQVRLRGRERARPEMWAAQLAVILERLADVAVVTQRPQPEGRVISAMIEPIAKK